MNRGSLAESLRSDSRDRASMRPRFMNRGSQVAEDVDRPVDLRFNEAPIHESGKSGAMTALGGVMRFKLQ